MKMMLFTLSAALSMACTSPSSNSSSSEPEIQSTQLAFPKTIEEAVASSWRSPTNLPRDIYRHPTETLKFFGVHSKATVIEISPGAGWYTEILAPFLQTEGRYIAAVVPAEKGAYFKKSFDMIDGWYRQRPSLTANYATFDPPSKIELAKDGTADFVLTVRNFHNWQSAGTSVAVLQAFYKALKPGGVLGIVEHRAAETGPTDPKAESGYVKQSEVIRLARSVGFRLDATSEINANPKDSKDHPKGVWTLPPTLALKEQNKALYLGIGESDRMTLRFVKP